MPVWLFNNSPASHVPADGERPWQKLVSLVPTFRLSLIIFLIAVFVRLFIIFAFHVYTDPFRGELERTAFSLATTGVYGNPYRVPTGPTAHVAPGYTLILAAILKIFGAGKTGEMVRMLTATCVSSLLWALMPPVSERLSMDKSVGVLAGLAGALLPARVLVEIDGQWEAPYTALALVLIATISLHLWRKQDLNLKQALLHGLAWGVCLLFVPALLDIFVVLLAAGFYFCHRAGWRRYLTFAGIEILAVAVCLAPWVVRNYRALGSPIVTRTNLGLELRVSNNDEASPDQRINSVGEVFNLYHPLFNTHEALEVRRLGEVAYNRRAEEEAKMWIRAHPRRFLELCLGRMRCYWLYTDPASRIKTLLLGGTVLLGFLGLVYLWRRNQAAGTLAALILVLYPLPNYLIHVGLRQEYPIHWLMTLLAALAITCMWEQIRGSVSKPPFASVRNSPRKPGRLPRL